ncbi:hypothetical protein FH972_014129 [Carpinus fangiana]|uniref:Uncharacterized protein n=1 Tax=Carpinus fangiana TaxID=176857 RepID=A0A5N6R944_9ROSI|nr:hypothetical protein FH972_014129 [Carpinus fangiana]
MVKKTIRETQEEKKATMERLPLESSPYVKYSSLEEYKSKCYGLQPKPNQAGAATDAPTLSGTGLSPRKALNH